MRYAAILCVLACSAVPASAQKISELRIADHRAAVTAYVSTFPLALLADDTCPGIKADSAKLLVLRATANVSDQEEAAVKVQMEKVEAGARLTIARNGAATWCRTVWSLIGEHGKTISGLLTRP